MYIPTHYVILFVAILLTESAALFVYTLIGLIKQNPLPYIIPPGGAPSQQQQTQQVQPYPMCPCYQQQQLAPQPNLYGVPLSQHTVYVTQTAPGLEILPTDAGQLKQISKELSILLSSPTSTSSTSTSTSSSSTSTITSSSSSNDHPHLVTATKEETVKVTASKKMSTVLSTKIVYATKHH